MTRRKHKKERRGEERKRRGKEGRQGKEGKRKETGGERGDGKKDTIRTIGDIVTTHRYKSKRSKPYNT